MGTEGQLPTYHGWKVDTLPTLDRVWRSRSLLMACNGLTLVCAPCNVSGYRVIWGAEREFASTVRGRMLHNVEIRRVLGIVGTERWDATTFWKRAPNITT